MRIDLYTKAVLTIIAIMVTVIASNELTSPRVANAQGPFIGIQWAAGRGFFDSRTGEIWNYGQEGKLKLDGRLAKLGQSLAIEYVK